MNMIKNYQKWVEGGTFGQDTKVEAIACAAMGLAGEAGETCDDVKKYLFHGGKMTEQVRDKIKEELGDTLWYAACLCNEMGWDITDVLADNILKLEERYPNVYEGTNSWAEVVRRSEEAPTLQQRED